MDIALESEQALQEYYDNNVAVDHSEGALAVYYLSGADVKWSSTTARNPVMHYPQCNGLNTGDLVLTSSDKTGTRALYP